MLRWKSSLKPAAAVSSYTLEETFADDSANEYEWSKAASTTYVGTLVAPASSYTATRLEFHLKKTGTGGNVITAEIWSSTGSAGSETPNALLATSTTTVAASAVSATKGFVAFDFAGQAIASGTKYFFVMKTPTTGDGSNYYDLTLGSSYNTTNFETVRADATPTWAVANGGRGGYCRSYSGGGGTSYKDTVLADTPLFYYRLGEASGTTAYDEVATSSNGTYNNTPSLGQTGAISGDSNTSVLFEEANSEDMVTTTLSSTSLLPCTIECFVKPSGASDNNAGIFFIRGSTADASGLGISGTTLGKLKYNWNNAANTYGYTGAPTLSDNTWYYVALVVESTKATFYVIDESGTLTTATNSVTHTAINASADPWKIARDGAFVRYFQGYIDEAAIYDQALSQSTVVAHAAAAGYEFVTPAGDALILNGVTNNATGGVETSMRTDGSSTVYGGYAIGNMDFRDATKNGSWTDDGLGCLWNQSTSDAEWETLLGTAGGTFSIYEQGTSTLIFSFAWTGTQTWSGTIQQYGQTTKDFTGTVPANATRIDVYHETA